MRLPGNIEAVDKSLQDFIQLETIPADLVYEYLVEPWLGARKPFDTDYLRLFGIDNYINEKGTTNTIHNIVVPLLWFFLLTMTILIVGVLQAKVPAF